jgi:hypothetical protein
MPKVIINNKEYEAQIGELLLDVARRNGAHIGYVFPFTSCRILRGFEHLSPPSPVEQNWFQPSWLETGHRLADQVTIQGPGPVAVLSDAEELRRLSMAVFTPPEGTTSGENAGLLLNNMGRTVINQIVRFPSNIFGAASVVGQNSGNLLNVPKAINDVQQIFNDGSRAAQQVMGGGKERAKAENIPITNG